MRKALTITLVAALALFAGSAAYANYCARDVVPASTILVPYVVNDMNGDVPDYDGLHHHPDHHQRVARGADHPHHGVERRLDGVPRLQRGSDRLRHVADQLPRHDRRQLRVRSTRISILRAYPNIDPAGILQRAPFEWGPDGRSAYAPPTEAGLPTPYPATAGTLDDTDCQMPYGTIDVSSNVACLRLPLTARCHYGCDHVANNIVNKSGHFNVRTKYNPGNDWLKNLTNDPLFYYVTVDVVDTCNFLFPSDATYFTDFYVNENVLIGDIVYLSSRDNFSEAINAVHIESDFDADGLMNFYEEKAAPDDLDALYLEPLATALAFDYYNGKDGVTSSVIMWKNFTEFRADGDVDDCGAYLYYAWDQDEHTISRSGSCQVSPCSVNDIDPNEFPFETQKVPINTNNFDLPANAGWMLVIFPPSYGFTDRPRSHQPEPRTTCSTASTWRGPVCSSTTAPTAPASRPRRWPTPTASRARSSRSSASTGTPTRRPSNLDAATQLPVPGRASARPGSFSRSCSRLRGARRGLDTRPGARFSSPAGADRAPVRPARRCLTKAGERGGIVSAGVSPLTRNP